jgi:hypothetical protein
MEITTDNEGNAIATQRNLGQRYRGLYKRENRCSDGFGDVGKYGSDDGWGTVLKTAVRAEFVTNSATATTPPQKQPENRCFEDRRHQRKIPLKHSVIKGFL